MSNNTATTKEPIWDSRNSEELSIKDINNAKSNSKRLEILFSGMNKEAIGIVRKSRLFEICEKSLA